MSERVLEMLSPQGKAGDHGLKGQKVRTSWAWVGTTCLMSFPPPFPYCPAPTLYSLAAPSPSPSPSKGLRVSLVPKRAVCPQLGVPSLNPASYRVMLGILEILECQAPPGSQDCRESLGFGVPWAQKEKRSVGQGTFCCVNKKKSG